MHFYLTPRGRDAGRNKPLTKRIEPLISALYDLSQLIFRVHARPLSQQSDGAEKGSKKNERSPS